MSFVCHDGCSALRSYAASFCDRVIILRDGVVWRTLEKGATDRSAFQDQLLDAIRDMSRE